MHVQNCVSPDHSFKRTQNISKIMTCFRSLDAYGTRSRRQVYQQPQTISAAQFYHTHTHTHAYTQTHTHYTCVVCYVIYIRVDMNNTFFPFSRR